MNEKSGVVSPAGRPLGGAQKLSPHLDTLEGKTIGEVYNNHFKGEFMFQTYRRLFRERDEWRKHRLLDGRATGERIGAVVSRGGRPYLAGTALSRIRTPTLLIVGGKMTATVKENEDEVPLLPARSDSEAVTVLPVPLPSVERFAVLSE